MLINVIYLQFNQIVQQQNLDLSISLNLPSGLPDAAPMIQTRTNNFIIGNQTLTLSNRLFCQLFILNMNFHLFEYNDY
jgi:hypothetical protein